MNDAVPVLDEQREDGHLDEDEQYGAREPDLACRRLLGLATRAHLMARPLPRRG